MPSKLRLRRAALTFYSKPDFKEHKDILYFVAGEEICPKTKKTHWQSYVSLTKPYPLSSLKKLLDDQKVHVEKCKGNEQQNITYCKKDGNIYREFGTPKEQGKRMDILAACSVISTLKRPRDGYDVDEIIPIMAKYPKFYAGYFRHTHQFSEAFTPKAPWQEEIWMISDDEPIPRVIHWYWSRKGNMGKTTVAKALLDHRDACLLGTGHNNVLYAYKHEPCCVFNLPRDTSDEHIPYKAMELLKDGAYFVGKYDSHFKRFKPPHVFVFANVPPTPGKLSEDRLLVTNVDN